MLRAFSTPSTVTWNFLILSCVALREWLIDGSVDDGQCSLGPFTPEKCGDEFVPVLWMPAALSSSVLLSCWASVGHVVKMLGHTCSIQGISTIAETCGMISWHYTRNNWFSFPGPLNTAQPEFLCCKTKLLMLFYINVLVYTWTRYVACMYQYETYGFIHDMLDLWLRHSPLRDFKDKYGAIGPHIGVVTARDWSCGLIYHIIYILTCKIFSLLYCCKMSSGSAFL